jgi:CRISPR-associated protein Csd1
LDETKLKEYMSLIAKWSDRHLKVKAVQLYVERHAILNDLSSVGITKVDEDTFIRFRVEISGDIAPDLWNDSSIVRAWCEFYEPTLTDWGLCYVTGAIAPISYTHPRGINKVTNHATLISSNDKYNFTYRGRFVYPTQANAVSYDASQKAHSMLRYLIERQGLRTGSQAVAAWAIESGEDMPNPFDDTMSLYGKTAKTKTDEQISVDGLIDADYGLKLRDALLGYGGVKRLSEHVNRIAVVAVDAATTGRMGITFYQELAEDEYLERVVKWHESCCWKHRLGNGNKTIVSAPSANEICNAVYGLSTGQGSLKIRKQARERILHMVLCGERISRDWVRAAVNHASSPFSFNKDRGVGWDMHAWENAVYTACALVRFHCAGEGEDYALELDTSCKNRSYLYGRLLAIADRIESHARYLQAGGADDPEKRPTNAIRYTQRFSMKPFSAWTQLRSVELESYIKRLDGAGWYLSIVDLIMATFEPGDFENDTPLDGRYLMGYSLQRLDLMRKKGNKESVNNADAQN